MSTVLDVRASHNTLHRGMSLMELMVALAILSIVLTLSLPSFAKWQEANEFKQALRHLTQLAESAKVAAISSQSDISVIVDINSGQCAGVSDLSLCDCTVKNACRVNGVEHIFTAESLKTKLTTSDNKNRLITFDKFGAVDFGHNTTVNVHSASYSGKVVISALGRVKQCSYGHLAGVAKC
ncbi:pilus assembly FimT family protein [Alteromonas sp. MB-3u-76]|uniref:pilus assembly FimT family protein n=1 Tax=Alteromonas sp. MB-3u-76 TaxID=2058133 RepID=UPI0012FDB97E|nr:prepilin-type N-terminal cleavage/methylation domain-containing protein [Alteromonas sp. MB-3u-76]